jgi:hypothetical protein
MQQIMIVFICLYKMHGHWNIKFEFYVYASDIPVKFWSSHNIHAQLHGPFIGLFIRRADQALIPSIPVLSYLDDVLCCITFLTFNCFFSLRAQPTQNLGVTHILA